MSFYERVLRPALFLLPAETAHELGKRALSVEFPWRLLAGRFRVVDPRLETEVAGLRQTSPLGLAAGFDKDGDALPGLACLGFGSVTVGTVMREPRQGNPSPRLARRPGEMALVNSLGLPSQGLRHAVHRLRRFSESRPPGEGLRPLVIASVGGFSIEEVLACHGAVEPWVDAVEICLTCPNVGVKGDFQKMEGIVRLAERLAALRRKPLCFKLPSRLSEETWEKALRMAEVAAEFGVEAVTAEGVIKVEEPRLAMGRGSLTGRPIFEHSLRNVRELREVLGGGTSIRVAGGAADGEGVFRLLEAGADAVNVLTAFVYRGPFAAAEMNRELLRQMDGAGVESVRELRLRRSRAAAPGG